MADVARMYGRCVYSAFLKGILWGEADNCKVALLTGTYAPDQDLDNFFDDVSANEIASGDGYTSGGKSLTWDVETSPLVFVGSPDPGGKLELRADDVIWASLTASFQHAVIYYDTGTPSTSPLIGYIQYNTGTATPVEPTAQDFTIEWIDGVVASIDLTTT